MGEGREDPGDGAADGSEDGLLTGDDDFNVIAGEEFEIVESEHVRRVAHGDDELHAASVDGDTGVFDGHIARDAFEDIFADFA